LGEKVSLFNLHFVSFGLMFALKAKNVSTSSLKMMEANRWKKICLRRWIRWKVESITLNKTKFKHYFKCEMQIEILQTISHYLSAEDKIGITLKSVLNWFQMFTSNNVKMYHGILIDRIVQKKKLPTSIGTTSLFRTWFFRIEFTFQIFFWFFL
jgi:hypothetical protein